ncbi:serine/threonine-protein kinase [Agaribacterium sp. ZY112]|uniref:serine/threonine-protein kinase n=1 Tax=Agaribacterium sp. ZY112 TaxID=3233574 RepID=UPI0035244AB1
MTIRIPGYRLHKTLGRGGMATVYLATQDVLGRKVALKVMHENAAREENFNERFLREAQIASQLVHPNIVTVHEVGEHEGLFFLSMEYIDGSDLASLQDSLTLGQKVQAIKDIAKALDYAGSRGYVHRDIKPENIMFRKVDGSAVLTDFGIARAERSDLAMTQLGTAVGTPHYMSPEQAKGRTVDTRSDLYSLGIVFFRMLTGQVPFDGESAVEIGIKHITSTVPELPDDLQALQKVLDHLLAKEADKRYQCGQQLIDGLESINVKKLQKVLVERAAASTAINTAAVPSDTGYAQSLDGTNESVNRSGLSSAQARDDSELSGSVSQRFTVEFENNALKDLPPESPWPLFFASVFVVCSLLFFIYMARPALLEPYILLLESYVTQAWGGLLSMLYKE